MGDKARKYWQGLDADEKIVMSEELDISQSHLRNVMRGNFQCSKELAQAIDFHTGGKVTRRMLLPNVTRKEWAGL